jgi:hypothetical protein
MEAVDIVLGSQDLMNEIAFFLPIEDRINLRLISKQMRSFVDQVMISDLRYVQYHILDPFVIEWKIKRRYNISHQHRVVHVIMNRTKSLGIDNTLYHEMVSKFYAQRLAHEVKSKNKPKDYQVFFEYGIDPEQYKTIVMSFDLTNYYATSVLMKTPLDNLLTSRLRTVDLLTIRKLFKRGGISLHDIPNDVNLTPDAPFIAIIAFDGKNRCTCRMCIKKILDISVGFGPEFLYNTYNFCYDTEGQFIEKYLKTFEPREGEERYIPLVDRIKKECVRKSLLDRLGRFCYNKWFVVDPWKSDYSDYWEHQKRIDPNIENEVKEYRNKMKRRAENPDEDYDSGTESDKERDRELERYVKYVNE